MSWTASLPPTRATGGGGVPALDVNALTTAIVETRDRIEDGDVAAEAALNLATSAHAEAENALEAAADAAAAVDGKLGDTEALAMFVQVGGGGTLVIWPPSTVAPTGPAVADGQLWLKLPT